MREGELVQDINWHPPRTCYVYQADLHCPDCAKEIMLLIVEREWFGPLQGDYDNSCKGILSQESMDSEDWPQEVHRFEDESDSPDHCAECHRFLGRPLTEDGVEYVKEYHALDPDSPVVQGWVDYYLLPG